MNFKHLIAVIALTFYMPLIATDESNSRIIFQDTNPGAPRLELRLFDPEDISVEPALGKLAKISPGYPMYYFRFQDFPIETDIFVSLRNLTTDMTKYEGKPTYVTRGKFQVRADGSIRNGETDRQNFFWFSSFGYLPGERVYCRFHTADGKLNKEISWILIPMIAYNNAKTVSIEGELLAIHPTIYDLRIKGLKEGEMFLFQSISGNEIIEHPVKFIQNLSISHMPGIVSISGGMNNITIISKTNGTITLRLPWGTMLPEYLVGKRIYKS